MTIRDMLGRSGVVTREEALSRLLEYAVSPVSGIEQIPISTALGRVIAEDIIASSDLPEFSRSTVDGYAVRASDTFGASESLPALFTVTAEIPMGCMPEAGIDKAECMKIATGGALPSGADAVVMLEYTQQVDPRTIEVMRPVAPLENVILAGDDIRKGEAVLCRGHGIRPQDMAALAGLGITSIAVYERPRVAVISTGNEIVPADSVSQLGRIRDSNSYYLEGLILQSGCVPVRKGIVPDDYELLRSRVCESLSECHMVILTGGSSVGAADYTEKVIDSFGPPGVLVHGVSLKPGKPLIAGWVGSVPVFGLPGHPVAVGVTFDLFVRPVLVKLRGESGHPVIGNMQSSRVVRARLARGISSSAGREEHVRVTLEKRDGEIWARPVFGPSGLISTLVKSSGTVVVPTASPGIEAGQEVEVVLFL